MPLNAAASVRFLNSCRALLSPAFFSLACWACHCQVAKACMQVSLYRLKQRMEAFRKSAILREQQQHKLLYDHAVLGTQR